MRVKKVRFKNGTKRFHDMTIDLGDNPARIVALVGPNGCGKSSVLDGMLYVARAHRQLGSTAGKDHNYYSLTGDPAFTWQNIEIDFTAGPFPAVYGEQQKAGKEGTIFSFRSPYRYNSGLKVQQTKATSEIRLNDYGASDAAAIDDKMEANYRRLYAFYNRYLEKNDVKPSDAKAAIIGELNKSISKCLELEISSIGNVEDDKGTLYFKKPGHPRVFDFNVLSSGEKEVIDLLLDLYLRKDAYDDTVFLIDEPELHISTAIQGNLLTEIDRLVGPNCQIWITTHSIGFLRALQTDMKDKCQIIRFKPELNLAAETHTLEPVEISPGVWRDLFSIALDDLAELVSPSTIIYCEGQWKPGKDGGEQGMDAQVLNIIFADSHPDVLFTSSGGNTEPDQRSAIAISILGKVFPTVKIWVFKDRDIGSGKSMSEDDRLTALKTSDDSLRIMKRWELENYLYDKAVLQAYCAANAHLSFDEATYDAKITDVVNDNVKDQTGVIKNICGIKTAVSPDKFKIELAQFVVPGMAIYDELEACIFKVSL